jgi:hypothetical protein
LMNAFNNINLAGTCLLTSTEYARALGIPESRWVYPLGGAGTHDSDYCRLPSVIVIHDIGLIAGTCSLGASQLLLKSLHLTIIGCRS